MSKKAKYVLLLMMVVCGAWTPFRLAAENKQAPIIEKIGQGKDEQIKPGTSPALSAIPPRSEVINKKVEQNALKEDKPPFEISAWIATCISAFVSLGALAVAIYQLRLFKAQLKIMSETLLAAHRARLVVRGFAIEINIEPPLDDKLPRVSFVIANVGDTPAFIEAISIKFHSQTDGNSISAKDEKEIYGIEIPQDFKLDGGESRLLTHTLRPKDDLDAFLLQCGHEEKPGSEPSQPSAFVGYVRYKDDRSKSRKTGFMRHFDFAKKQFTIADNPDYEYQD